MDAFFNIVTDRADSVDGLTSGVGYFPVLVAFAREDGAGIAATHGDDDIGGLDDLVGPGLGEFAGDIDADLGHGFDGGGVDFVSGFSAARPGHTVVTGEVGEEAERHLRAAGVVGAKEQHRRPPVVDLAFNAGQGVEALAGETLG